MKNFLIIDDNIPIRDFVNKHRIYFKKAIIELDYGNAQVHGQITSVRIPRGTSRRTGSLILGWKPIQAQILGINEVFVPKGGNKITTVNFPSSSEIRWWIEGPVEKIEITSEGIEYSIYPRRNFKIS